MGIIAQFELPASEFALGTTLDTRIAGVLLGGALLSDVAVLVVFAGVLGFIETGRSKPDLSRSSPERPSPSSWSR